MKLETIQVLAPGELRRMVAALIGKHGSATAAAIEMNVQRSALHNYLAGRRHPARKILNYFGLEARRVIVRKAPISPQEV